MANQTNSPWTAERDERLRRLWDEGHTTLEIGAMMGVTKNSVIGRVHRLKLAQRGSPILVMTPRTWTRAEDEKVRVMKRRGYSVRCIAREIGCSRHAVDLRLNELDLAQKRQQRETARAATGETVRARGAAPRGPSVHPQSLAAAPLIPASAGDPSRPVAERTMPVGVTTPALVDVSSQTARPVALPAPAGTFCKGPCRWPLWGDNERPTHRFCEKPRERGAYCAEHGGRAYTMTATQAGPAPVARWA